MWRLIFWSLIVFLRSDGIEYPNKYFRVPHRLHYKLNFSCKNQTFCQKPSETESFLSGFPWPKRISDFSTCMDLECICPMIKGKSKKKGKCFLPNGKPLGKAIRKEYRQLSRKERKKYEEIMLEMQKDGNYRLVGGIHRAAGVHSGPSFFPWHREFLKRTEFLLRSYDQSMAVPYWDSTLDGFLPNPADSIMFSNHLMGEADENGDVYDTVFKNFTTLDDRPTWYRRLNNTEDGEMINEARINWILKQTNITKVLAYSMPLMGCEGYEMDDRFLEFTHDYVHYFVNGDMEDRVTSSNDPIFFLHHSFVDYIWEMWRQKQQTREERENQYPEDLIECMPPWHFKKAKLPLLAPFRNLDGLSNKYMDNLSAYAPRPKCSHSTSECKSEFLFCDTKTTPLEPHCVSKVKLNGNCTGFEWSKEICYEGECINGQCFPVEKTTVPTEISDVEIKTTEKNPFRFEVLEVHEVFPRKNTKVSRYM